jgi:creatinine amidohydrolase
MRWDELPSRDIGELDRSIPVILPVAAIEQHGPHLPVATDRIINEHFCRELDARLPEDILVLPTMAVGCSEHHMDFPGTLTLKHETFIRAAENILRSVAAHGFKNLMMLNSHGGNQGVGQVIVEHLGARLPNCQLVFTSWWKHAHDALLELNETGPGGVGHACEFETSIMLLTAPELVKVDRIEKGANQPTFEWAKGDLLRGGTASLYRSMKAMTPNGVYGDPRQASAEKGEAVTRVVVNVLEGLARDLRSSHS